MVPYLETRFLGTLLVRTALYGAAWELIRDHFEPPFFVTPFQALRIEHMLLHQRDDALRVAALRGHQDWHSYLQEGVFQLSTLDWDGSHRLALDLNRRSLEHQISPLHYFDAASACLLEASHFVSLDLLARVAASMAGVPLLPSRLA
jgi:hypothetical protein